MATSPPQPQSQRALVSSLYGPGTITCWYLTTLSVLLSWTLHPQKRKSGSIDVDLIAVLTLPAVAAGHLVSQFRGFLHQDGRTVRGASDISRSVDDGNYLQSIAAIEAPFNVTETFMAISVILFIVAALMFCIRRAILVGLIGLLCFIVECAIHFSSFTDLGLRYRPGVSADDHPTFSRFFVADFAGLVIAILVVLSLCGVISAAIAFYMLLPPKIASSGPRPDVEGGNEAAPGARTPLGSGASVVEATRSVETIHETQLRRNPGESSLRSITMVTILFLPLSLVASVMPLAWPSTRQDSASATASPWQTLDESIHRLGRNLFPRTACSVTDLDQGVAAAAGATVLGFSIYSVAKAYYKIWSARRTTPTAPRGTELSRIENSPVM